MNDKTEATLAIIAALLVLFTTMLDPRVSAGLAVVLLVGFAVVKLVNSRGGRQAVIQFENRSRHSSHDRRDDLRHWAK